jgi:hypothetical protein
MNMASLPLIHDLEGRVNEYEQKTVQDNLPQPGDRDSTIAAKRKALEQFFNQKASAPTAKGFGIDLDRFQSTSTKPEANLTPQQQSFANWAKANPNDARAKVVLKKLGLE